MNPLAVTGLGVVSPLGVGLDALREGLRSGVSAFRAPTLFKSDGWPGASVAEVRDFNAGTYVGEKGLRTTDRLTRLFLVATRLALTDAGLKRDGRWEALGPDDVGVCAATAYGSLEAITELDRVAKLEDPRYLNPSKFPNTVINSALGYVSIWEDLRALNVTVVNGPCGAVDALNCASTYLYSERAKAVVVGGGEALHEALYLAMERVGAVNTEGRPWAPGDSGSQGFRLGEGAVMATLEDARMARARGARARLVVLGCGAAFEPPARDDRLTVASSESLRRAIREALDDADVRPEDVDVVASGLSGLWPWDAAELTAIERTVGGKVCVAAPRALVGECLGADGAMALAHAALWCEGEPVGAVVRGEAPARVRTVLIPVLGFYGNASALVVRRPE